MSKYVLAFRGQPGRDPAQGEDEAWGAWFGQLGATIVDIGNRVGHVERVEAQRGGDAAKETLTGYVLIEAADINSAVNVARGCPGLKSGVSVEVAETIPMTG
jgi:YCII-related domain